jgi:hypothetical protein
VGASARGDLGTPHSSGDGDANEVTFSEFEPGDFFGEMSVLDGGKQSAIAQSSVPVVCQLSQIDLYQPEPPEEILRNTNESVQTRM